MKESEMPKTLETIYNFFKKKNISINTQLNIDDAVIPYIYMTSMKDSTSSGKVYST